MPDLSARIGVVDDLGYLVNIYAQLDPPTKDSLWAELMLAMASRHVPGNQTGGSAGPSAEAWLTDLRADAPVAHDQVASLVLQIRQITASGWQGSAPEIGLLMEVYGWFLQYAADGFNPLVAAAEALAQQRVQQLAVGNEDAIDAQEWLTALAKDVYPHDEAVGRLLSMAQGAGLAVDDVFAEGALATVLCGSELQLELGEGLFVSYESGVQALSAYQRPATTQKFFGIEVPETDFRVFDGDEWKTDTDAWHAAIDRRCAERFMGFVVCWRHGFFGSLFVGADRKLSHV